MASLCVLASLVMVLWHQCACDQLQTPPQMPQIPETYTTVQVHTHVLRISFGLQESNAESDTVGWTNRVSQKQ